MKGLVLTTLHGKSILDQRASSNFGGTSESVVAGQFEEP